MFIDEIDQIRRGETGGRDVSGDDVHNALLTLLDEWWPTLETKNQHRPALIPRLAEKLKARSAPIAAFFLAYVSSNANNLQANLHYLDYQRLNAGDEKRGTK